MTKEELKSILINHALWISNQSGVKADLRGADLRRADLQGANLQGADLQGANLLGADLWRVDLLGANLQGANLQGADLLGANLRGANLQGADLLGADLLEADLLGANLQGANLQGADLRRANLQGADLQGADLRRADLLEADLRRADLLEAKFAVTQVFMADWRIVSDSLCAQLMMLDALSIPNGICLMTEWANGGECPMVNAHSMSRVVIFQENRRCWDPNTKLFSLWEIWVLLAQEKGVRISSGE